MLLIAIALVVLSTAGSAAAMRSAAAATGALGSQAVEPALDTNTQGLAQAFQTSASSTGSVSSLVLYVDGSSTAESIVGGVYADAGGHPGALLASGRKDALQRGSWNTIALGQSVPVSGGASYWLAFVPLNGNIGYRDRCCGVGGTSFTETSAQTGLGSLPSSWSTGTVYHDGPVSGYGVIDVPVSLDSQAPTAPPNLKTLGQTASSISIAWSAATDNIGVTGYTLYRNGAAVDTTSLWSYTVGGLSCGTSYTLAVDAYDALGNHSAKSSIALSTSACPSGGGSTTDAQSPSAPGTPTLAGATTSSLSLTWSQSLDNVGVAGYTIYRDGVTAGTSALPAYTLSGLTCGRSYTVAVEAYDAAGNRSPQTSVTTSTSACPATPDVTAPSRPSGFAKKSATKTSITVSWGASLDNVGVAGYGMYRSASRVATAGAGAREYTFTGLACGKRFTLGVDAYDAAGNRSGRARAKLATAACGTSSPADTQAPTAPSSFRTTSATQTSLAVAWNASTDNVGVTGYTTYRNSAAAGSTGTTAYTLSGLACGTSYSLAVDAYDAAGNRSTKTALTASTSACATADTQAPTIPAGLVKTSAGANSISFAWSGSTDNVGVAGYGVYRNNVVVGSSSVTAYTLSGLDCGTSYTIGVDAYDAAANRSAQGLLNASTSACPAPSGANLYLSPAGSDSNPCSQSAPCRTLQRGYSAASPGQVVELAGGSYGSQSLSGTKGSPAVVIRPAAGAAVTLGTLSVDADWIEIRDVAVNGELSVHGNSDFATLRNLNTNDRLYVEGPRDLSIIGGDFGPSVDAQSWITHNGSGTPGQRILIQGAWFHDHTVSDPSVHTECLAIIAGDGITLRGNRWTNCAIFDASFGFCCMSSRSPSNVLIENNFFGRAIQSTSGISLHFNTNLSPANYTIRNNSSAGPWVLDQGQGSWSNVRAVGNALPYSGCGRVSWSYNVFTGGSCSGSGNKQTSNLMFADASGADFHLLAGSPLVNSGSPSDYASIDYDGRTRPMGGAPDAGAVEAG